MDKEFTLLYLYLSWRIDRCKPITDEVMFMIYEDDGYVETGRNWKDLPSFEQWKTLFNPVK